MLPRSSLATAVALALVAAAPLAAHASSAPVVPPARSFPPSAPVVANGGFESTPVGVVADLAGGVDGWLLETGGGVTMAPEYAVVDDVTHTGDRALRVTVNQAGPNVYDVQAIATPLAVTPGQTYVYAVWAKAAADGGTVNVTVGNNAFAEYGRLGDQALTTEWQAFSFEFTVSDQETEIRAPIHFSFPANVGNAVFLDDLSVVVKPDPSEVTTNGSFEDTEAGPVTDLADGVSGFDLEIGGRAAATFAVVDDQAYLGDQSLRVTVSTVGQNVYDVQAIATPLPVTPGETYVYSAWAKAEAAGATVNFTVGNDAFMEYGRLGERELSTDWQEFTFEFTVTDQETEIRAPIHFSFGPNLGNAVYVDALTIRPAGAVASEPASGAGRLVLEQNRPNPAAGATTIAYTLATPGVVTLDVFDAVGHRVATVADGPREAGTHAVRLPVADLAAGVYVYRLRAGAEVGTRRMVVVR